MRATLGDTAQRSQTSTSRGTLREWDDDHLWPQMKKVDVFHSETPSDVEFAQDYGFAFHPMPQDEEEGQGQQQQGQQGGQQGGSAGGGAVGAGGGEPEMGKQPKGDAAEVVIMYANGSRSHPIGVRAGDRRHRLKGIKKGEVAVYDHDQQQMHLTEKGIITSAPTDRKIRMHLVTTDKQQKQQQQASSSGGGQGGGAQGGQQGKQKKEYGQKPQAEKDSTQYVEIGSEKTDLMNKEHQMQLDDKDTAIHMKNKNVYVGGLLDKAKFAKLVTVAGPCSNGFGRIG